MYFPDDAQLGLNWGRALASGLRTPTDSSFRKSCRRSAQWGQSTPFGSPPNVLRFPTHCDSWVCSLKPADQFVFDLSSRDEQILIAGFAAIYGTAKFNISQAERDAAPKVSCYRLPCKAVKLKRKNGSPG